MTIKPMFAPDGTPIIGTIQTVEAIATIEGVDVRDGDAIYTGASRILWDTMEEKHGHSRSLVFVDANGRRWSLGDLQAADGTVAYRYRPFARERKRARRRGGAGREPSVASSEAT